MEHLMTTLPASLINFAGEDGQMMQDTITIEEAYASSRTTLDALFEAWTQLRSITARHQTTLNKRWLKKTTNQRTEVLIKAWPNMPPMHRPDIVVLRQEQGGKVKAKFPRDSALRFPHINIDDLSQPKPLLLMIESRSQDFPSVFTNADRDSIRVGIRSKMLVPKYMRGYAMYLNGEHARETYGRLVSWEENRQAVLHCHKGIAPDPGMGLMILEIQRKTLQFLVRCCTAILHDISIADLMRAPTESLPDSTVPQLHVATSWGPVNALSTENESLTVHALEAPYRAPDAYDFTRLKSLVEAKCHEVEDHFLLIREDPDYLAELMHEECGHTVEAVLNRQYRPGTTPLSEASWNEAISRVLMTAYHDAFMWETVSHLFDKLVATYTKHKANIQPGRALPDAYVEASSHLAYVLECIILGYLDALPDYMSAVLTFKKYISNKPCAKGGFVSYIVRQPDDYLYWLFAELVGGQYGKKEQICGLPNLLQEMETLLAKDQQQKNRLTWRLIRLVADVAVIAEMQRQLGLSTVNDYTLSAWSDEENEVWMDTRMAPLHRIRDVLQEGTGLAPHVMDLRVFDYPSDKPRTAATTAKMRNAEQALENFWEKIDQHFIHKTGKTLKQLEENRVQYRNIQRTPPWEDPRPLIQEGEHDRKLVGDLDTSLALATLQERTESTIDTSQALPARQKTKTRGLPAYPMQDGTPRLVPETINDTTSIQSPRLTVKKKAFHTFTALFGKPLAGTLRGELPWNEFKKAMVNVRFSAEKLQGSAWLFESGRKSIIFHEPHPESKLPMQWARRIARRLNRNFGWTADTFVLEDATSVENTEPGFV
ncbi:MAG: hypothetical protein L6R39_006941 [Caloplaca ligustica]|nr:MAG: hypothetical protein L6R39_006941 [Caloplaca ligustica]